MIFGTYQNKSDEERNLLGIFSKIISSDLLKSSDFYFKQLIDDSVAVDLNRNEYSKMFFKDFPNMGSGFFLQDTHYLYKVYSSYNCNNNMVVLQIDKFKNNINFYILNRMFDCLNSDFISMNLIKLNFKNKILVLYFDNKDNLNKQPKEINNELVSDELDKVNFVFSIMDENLGFNNKKQVFSCEMEPFYLDLLNKLIIQDKDKNSKAEMFLVGSNPKKGEGVIYKILIE